MTYKQPDGLISVLLDFGADEASRDDAAMDLAGYDAPEALEALVLSIRREQDEMLLCTQAESIVEIWIRRDNFDPTVYLSMPNEPRGYLFMHIKEFTPAWIAKYNLPDEDALAAERKKKGGK